MQHDAVLILGGYGNAGLTIARLLTRQRNMTIILAGRNHQRAAQAAAQLNAELHTASVRGVAVDAANRESLLAAFQRVDMVIVAASTIEHTRVVAETALEAGIDYFDIQIAVDAKRDALEALRERILHAGRCFITDGGFRPGIPAAMVRYAAIQIPGLIAAPVASVFQLNWKQRQFASSSAEEFVDEITSFSQLILKDGVWQQSRIDAFKQVDFGAPFGLKYCMPMFLEELRPLPELIPSLKEAGFFSAGFGGSFDYVIMPLAFGLAAIAPRRSRNVIARLVEWGLKHTTRPPYGAVLQMQAQGPGRSLVMTVAHEDAYIMTAAPAVACFLQYADGTIRKPGLWRQGTLVEPVRFFEDLARMGVQVHGVPCAHVPAATIGGVEM